MDRLLAFDHGTTGLVGTLTYSIKAVDGSVLVAPTAIGITEVTTGNYAVSVPVEWAGVIIWDDGEAPTIEAFIQNPSFELADLSETVADLSTAVAEIQASLVAGDTENLDEKMTELLVILNKAIRVIQATSIHRTA